LHPQRQENCPDIKKQILIPLAACGRWRVGLWKHVHKLRTRNHVYNVTVERRDNQFFITYNNNEYTVSANERKTRTTIDPAWRPRDKKWSSHREKIANSSLLMEVSLKVKRIELTGREKDRKKKKGDLNSPISGTVVTIKVKQGNQVKKDDVILVIEAMKMEYLIRAPYKMVKSRRFISKKKIRSRVATQQLR